MALQLSGKDKAARVPLGYYRFLGAGRKTWAIGIVIALAVMAVGAVVLGYWKQAASPGPIHSAHARWENDCSSCHTPFSPTGSSNGLNSLFASKSKPSDALCQQCHLGYEEQEHHKTQIASEVESCASCHKDHRGRSAFISRVSDAKCTSCHNDLKSHTKDKATIYANKVSLFERDHPQFRLGKGDNRLPVIADKDGDKKATDPGNLRFNHQLHLTEGLDVNWTYKRMIDSSPDPEQGKKYAERYKQLQKSLQKVEAIDDAAMMKLDCASCHVLSGTDEPGRKSLVRQPGDYVLPVTFEQHCKACHPLTFSSKKELKNVEIPHHLQPAQMGEFLTGAFVRAQVAEKMKTKTKAATPLPGQDPDEPRAREELKADAAKGVQFMLKERDQGEKAGRDTNCRVCHHVAAGKGPADPDRILPTNVPEVWYEHARFSHQAHRTVDCRGCHNGADKSTTEKDVLLPGVKNCVQCHASAKTVSTGKEGGVRQECVTCHNYHHGDVPLAGRGAEVRGVKGRVDLNDWLNNKFGGKK